MKLIRLDEMLAGIKFEAEKNAQPLIVKTPTPEKQKVISKTPRVPVNKQAALLIAPWRCWLSQPFEFGPERKPDHAECMAKMKKLNNRIGEFASEIGMLRSKIKELTKQNGELGERNLDLNALNKRLKAQVSDLQNKLNIIDRL